MKGYTNLRLGPTKLPFSSAKVHKLFSYTYMTSLVHDTFVGMNLYAIAMIFIRATVVEMAMHCDHTVHTSTDLSLWLDSPMFWAP